MGRPQLHYWHIWEDNPGPELKMSGTKDNPDSNGGKMGFLPITLRKLGKPVMDPA